MGESRFESVMGFVGSSNLGANLQTVRFNAQGRQNSLGRSSGANSVEGARPTLVRIPGRDPGRMGDVALLTPMRSLCARESIATDAGVVIGSRVSNRRFARVVKQLSQVG